MPQAEFLDQIAVTAEILVPEILQKPSPASDHLQEAPLGVVIFFMNLEVFRKFPYAGGKYGNLDFRGTGVGIVGLEFLDDSLFLLLLKHFFSPLDEYSRNQVVRLFAKPSIGFRNYSTISGTQQTNAKMAIK